jgi:formate-dependent phosphoribosylglycinamide formyltransferase (GAR transformylase)
MGVALAVADDVEAARARARAVIETIRVEL